MPIPLFRFPSVFTPRRHGTQSPKLLYFTSRSILSFRTVPVRAVSRSLLSVKLLGTENGTVRASSLQKTQYKVQTHSVPLRPLTPSHAARHPFVFLLRGVENVLERASRTCLFTTSRQAAAGFLCLRFSLHYARRTASCRLFRARVALKECVCFSC